MKYGKLGLSQEKIRNIIQLGGEKGLKKKLRVMIKTKIKEKHRQKRKMLKKVKKSKMMKALREKEEQIILLEKRIEGIELSLKKPKWGLG